MAEKRDVSHSILASDGKDIKSGVLSLLQKRASTIFKSGTYELCPLYWRLLSYAGDVYMLGYTRQQPGQKPTKRLSVKGCPTDFALPTKAVVSRHSNETFICIQKGESLTFLQAESRRQRDKWVEEIRQALSEPIYRSSASSTSSADTLDFRHGDAGWSNAHSVHGTADTRARASPFEQHRRTAPAGNFPKLRPGPAQEDSHDLVSDPYSSARALQRENEKRRSDGLRHSSTVSSFMSSPNTLQSTELSRPRSLHGIYSDESTYSGFEDCAYLKPNIMGHGKLTSQLSRSNPNLDYLSLPGLRENNKSFGGTESEAEYEQMKDKDMYMEVIDDDQSSAASVVQNLTGMQEENMYDIYVDFDNDNREDKPPAPPAPPPRDYMNVPFVPQKRLSSKKNRAPPPPPKSEPPKLSKKPETDTAGPVTIPGDVSMDSIEREKTVCLEKESRANVDMLKRVIDNTREEKAVTEPLSTYVLKFRSEHFEVDGVLVAVPKKALSRDDIKLVCIGDQICVAALYTSTLHRKLHVGDVITKVNAQSLPSVNFCYDLFQTTDETEVRLLVKRVAHGALSHVSMAANGNVPSLGLQFENKCQGIEVTKIEGTGLVAKSGHPSQPRAVGVVNGSTPVNWGLVEINQSPVPLDSKPEEVVERLRSAGCELVLVFLPMDVVQILKEKQCDDKEGCCGDKP